VPSLDTDASRCGLPRGMRVSRRSHESTLQRRRCRTVRLWKQGQSRPARAQPRRQRLRRVRAACAALPRACVWPLSSAKTAAADRLMSDTALSAPPTASSASPCGCGVPADDSQQQASSSCAGRRGVVHGVSVATKRRENSAAPAVCARSGCAPRPWCTRLRRSQTAPRPPRSCRSARCHTRSPAAQRSRASLSARADSARPTPAQHRTWLLATVANRFSLSASTVLKISCRAGCPWCSCASNRTRERQGVREQQRARAVARAFTTVFRCSFPSVSARVCLAAAMACTQHPAALAARSCS
jgi:hypothetical protein